MEIDLLYLPDCPNRVLARDILEQALARTGQTAVVREHVIGSVEEAERLGMRGSPTILIDGRDAFPGGPALAAWSCRIYATDEGLRGVPTLQQLTEALMA